eukprot:scaffold44181_cov62-Phaeocystis_antarctica.AAC.1
MKNWRDGERAATTAAMSAPSETPQMPLTGACRSIQRSTCRTLSSTAVARLASFSANSSSLGGASWKVGAKVAGAAVLSCCHEARVQLGLWAHHVRRVHKFSLDAMRSQLGSPAGQFQYLSHQGTVPCLPVQHEQYDLVWTGCLRRGGGGK